MEVALAGAVGVPGVEERGEDGQDVGGRCEKEGRDLVVVKGFDDGGEEVGHGAGGDDAEDEEHLVVSVVDMGIDIERET